MQIATGLVAGLALLAPFALPAAAEAATLRGLGSQVAEVSSELDVRVRGWVAEVTIRQTVVAGTADSAAVYTFDVPSDAAVVGLSVTLPGGKKTRAELIDASYAVEASPPAPGAMPDAALLRLVEINGRLATYELRVFPVGERQTTSWSIEVLAPMTLRDGRLALRWPARGRQDNLVTEAVTVTASPPQGFSGIARIIGSGQSVGGAGPARFKASAKSGMSIEIEPSGAAAAASLEMASVALPGGRSAVAYGLRAGTGSAQKRELPDSVLFVVDVSRSMTAEGRRAAAELTRAILEAAPASLPVDALLFDRAARTAWDGTRPNGEDTRTALAAAIEAAPGDNGSDLGAALAMMDARLRQSGRGPTLVVVLSDGLSPLELSPAKVLYVLSKESLERHRFAQLSLIPNLGPLPRRDFLALAGVVERTDGRFLELRHGEVASRKASVWTELLAAAPLTELHLEGEDELLAESHSVVPAGGGVFEVGLARMPRPRKLTATAVSGTRPVTVTSRYRSDLERAILPLTLATMQVLPDGFGDLELYDLARSAGVVTRVTALWAGHPGDEFARSRLALARKFGGAQFRRLPSPAEADETYRSYQYTEPPPEGATPPVMTTPRPTGSLDRAIVQRLMRTHVVPKVHGCYRRALVPSRNLRGTLTVVVELVRGEVQDARVEGSLQGAADWAAKVEQCAVDAAYSIRVPTVQLGDDSETVSLVRYPLTLKVVDSQGRVIEDFADPKDVGTDDPLDGL